MFSLYNSSQEFYVALLCSLLQSFAAFRSVLLTRIGYRCSPISTVVRDYILFLYLEKTDSLIPGYIPDYHNCVSQEFETAGRSDRAYILHMFNRFMNFY